MLLAAASMKRSAEISSASDLLKRELIPLPNATPGDEAEGTLRQNRSGKYVVMRFCEKRNYITLLFICLW